jgi:ABC-type branched-subunit amino acid transport system substrate-binding protein
VGTLLGRAGTALLAALFAASVGAAGLSAQEQAGKLIYTAGESPTGAKIVGRIGMGGLEISGAAVACGNCHGEDGRGRPEGGVVPSNIQWSELTKPYGHHHDSGRRHRAFDDDSLRRSIFEGVDPDGNPLEGAMPRYSMSAKDFAALAAYMKRLESDLDAGLGSESIRIGTLLPTTGRLQPLGQALRTLWTSYFAALNERGGIHGRRLELVVQALPEDPAQAAAATRALLVDGSVFAVLAPVSVGIEHALSDAASAAQVPVIGPLTLHPEDARASNPNVFHLLPGVTELAQVLARHAQRQLQLAQQPILLWHPDTADGRATAQALEDSLLKAGWRVPLAMPFLPRGTAHGALAAILKQRDVAAVLVLGGGGDIAALAAEASQIGWSPQLLLPGPLVTRDIVALPLSLRGRVTLAYPTSPDNQRGDAMREYAALMQGRGQGASRAFQPAQLSAYAAGLLLVEGLKRTGRDLSRRKLVATLETVQSLETGLLPPLSYNADRRIGALGGYLVSVDLDSKGLRPLGGYLLP